MNWEAIKIKGLKGWGKLKVGELELGRVGSGL